ncbi:alpha/beta fold hydrolase [Streptomyces silvisoli]|uniref:Alpha/beta hydrolase n=1 Tax=Streptomyces silvisoli TaxID=3034235 RepID=A0ABT5ZRK4_9ACTN|nr:alpha/beta hydrolase [Streptomyces silvisoli]MDF3292240.1 alpha/beta hydrolase [Streptomyces silvisoli]
MILVHGLMGTANTHYGPCQGLWTHPVVTVDLPGHGTDEELPSHPAAVAIDRVRAAIRAQPQPPLVVGLSYLGAAVALRASAAEGSRAVHGVVLSGYSLIVGPSTLGRWLTAFTDMAADQQGARAHFAQVHGPEWERLLTATTAELSDGCLTLPQVEDIERLGLPVLLINGALLENERLAVQPAAKAGADVAVVAGAGHLVPPDSPRTFVAAVEEFSTRITEQRTTFHERRRSAARAAGRDTKPPAAQTPTGPDAQDERTTVTHGGAA